MTIEETAKAEAKAFEYNAKEGVRLVAFLWFLRRIAIPLFAILLVVVVTAFATNGPTAGFFSLAIFGGLALLLWGFTSRQGAKVLEYWKK